MTELCKWLCTGSRKYHEGNHDIHQDNVQKWKPLTPSSVAGEAERPIVVASASAVFGKLRGNVPSPTKVFKKSLVELCQVNQRQPTKFQKVCPRCHTRTTFNERDNSHMKIHPVLTAELVILDGTEIIWQVSTWALFFCTWLPTTTIDLKSFGGVNLP